MRAGQVTIMLQFRLKDVLGAMLWFTVALAIFNAYLQARKSIDAWLITQPGAWIDWTPAIPTGLCVPLLMAAVFTLFGRTLLGVVLGLPATIYAAYCWWAAS